MVEQECIHPIITVVGSVFIFISTSCYSTERKHLKHVSGRFLSEIEHLQSPNLIGDGQFKLINLDLGYDCACLFISLYPFQLTWSQPFPANELKYLYHIYKGTHKDQLQLVWYMLLSMDPMCSCYTILSIQ